LIKYSRFGARVGVVRSNG